MSITPLTCIGGTRWQFAIVPVLPICFTRIDGALTTLSARQQTPHAVTKHISLITKSNSECDSIIAPVCVCVCFFGLFSTRNVFACCLCSDRRPLDIIKQHSYRFITRLLFFFFNFLPFLSEVFKWCNCFSAAQRKTSGYELLNSFTSINMKLIKEFYDLLLFSECSCPLESIIL